MEGVFVHESSYIDEGAVIGDGTKIWHFCHVQSGAEIGCHCSLGQNVNVGSNVKIGNGVKIQNNVSVYEGVTLADYVFCGPSCVFTNDLTPRAKYPKGNVGYKATPVGEGASIGANATIVCGHEVGAWSLILTGRFSMPSRRDTTFPAPRCASWRSALPPTWASGTALLAPTALMPCSLR